MKRYIITLGTILVITFTAGSLWAQDIKVACIDSQKVMSESKAGKGAFKQLSALKDQKEAEAKKRQEKINNLKKTILSKTPTINQASKDDLAAQYQHEIKDYERFLQDTKDELRKTENKILNPWSRELDEIVKAYAEKNGIDLVLDKSSSLYTSSKKDISKDIIELFNKRYDEKSGKNKAKMQ
jgi:outer membrane protein